MLPDRFDPADDFDLGDERETERPEVFASTLADVQAGRRFVGALYRENTDEPDAPDDALDWLCAFTEDAPGTMSDVLEMFGAGVYRVRTATEPGQQVGRRLVLRVGRQTSRPAPPVQTAPEVPAASMDALREEAARAARSAVQWEKDDLERQLARATREKSDALETLDRAKADLARAQSDALTLSGRLAASQDEATKARRELAELSLTHAQAVAELRSAHSDELDDLRGEVQESRADARIRDFELTMAQNGEKVPTESILSVLREIGGPVAKEIAASFAARQSAQTPTAAPSALPPMPPAHRAFSLDSGDYPEPVYDAPAYDDLAYQGDGHAAAATLAPAAPVAVPTTTGTVTEALSALSSVARAVVAGQDVQIAPSDMLRLVAAAQTTGVTAEDFRSLAAETLRDAIDARTSPDALAAFLAPLAAPFAGELRAAVALPAKYAVGLVADRLGLDVPKASIAYVGQVLVALKALL